MTLEPPPPGGGFASPTSRMRFIDSHTHLADAAFDPDRDAAVARAREAGAVALVCIGESLAAADRARALSARHPRFVYWTAGIHPHDAATFDEARDLPAIAARLDAGAVAVGECGLDYHYDHAPRERQRAAFRAQLALGAAHRKPVVVHTRDAEDDTSAMLAEESAAGARGVLHCFTGTAALARAALDCGWYVSFSGIVTFTRWTDDALLQLVPEDRLLVESDAPYLAPVPHRGRRNEPAWVPRTIERIARARGVETDALADGAARNARRLFGLDP